MPGFYGECTYVPCGAKPTRGTNVVPRGGILPPWLRSSLSPASRPPLPRERLKPHAIDIRVNIDPVHWFLSPPSDTRSSLYRSPYHSFRGAHKTETSRTDVKKPERRHHLKNASVAAEQSPRLRSAATQLKPEQAALAWASSSARRC